MQECFLFKMIVFWVLYLRKLFSFPVYMPFGIFFLGCVDMQVLMCANMHVSVSLDDIMNKNDFLNNRIPLRKRPMLLSECID